MTPRKVFNGQRFVLLGTWPGLEGSQGITLGKEMVKAVIERHGGQVTTDFSRLTNFLVIGEKSGQKKVLNAHERGIQIICLD